MAKLYCEELILNTYTDWKLPTIEQLLTTIDVTNKNKINKHFKNTIGNKYITKSKFILDAHKLWFVDFKHGALSYDLDDKKYYIRCVRDIK
jgi:hypothetical protein